MVSLSLIHLLDRVWILFAQNVNCGVGTLIAELNRSGVGTWFRQLRWTPRI